MDDDDNYLVVTVGGSKSFLGERPLAVVEVFQTTSRTWERWSNMTYPRMNASCAVGFGGVVVGLGTKGHPKAPLSVEYIVNKTANLLPDLPTAAQCPNGTLAALSDDSISLVCPGSSTSLWVLDGSSYEWQQAWAETLLNMDSIVKVDSTGSLFLSEIPGFNAPPISALFSVANGSLLRFQCSVGFECPVIVNGKTAWLCLFTTDEDLALRHRQLGYETDEGPAWPQFGGNANFTFQGRGDWRCFPVSAADALVFVKPINDSDCLEKLLVGVNGIVYSLGVLTLKAFNGTNGVTIWTREYRPFNGVVGLEGQLYVLEDYLNLTILDGGSGMALGTVNVSGFISFDYVDLSIGSDGYLYVYGSSKLIHRFDPNLVFIETIDIYIYLDTKNIAQVLVTDGFLYAHDHFYAWAFDLQQQQGVWSSLCDCNSLSWYRGALYECSSKVLRIDPNTGAYTQYFGSGDCTSMAFYKNNLVATTWFTSLMIEAYDLETGDLLWSQPAVGYGYSSPSRLILGANGTVFFGRVALDINTGRAKWDMEKSYLDGGENGGVIGAGGTLYIVDSACSLVVFNGVAEEWSSSNVTTV